MKLTNWCDRVIHIGFYLLFGLVPLLLTPWNYELFEFNKMMAVYGLTVVIVGAWIIKMISQKELRIARTPLDIPIALFVSSLFVSSLFSIDPHVSWFGYYSRFNGGMWSIISYVLLYYAFVSNSRFSVLGSRSSDRGQPVNRSTVQPISDNRKLKTDNVLTLLKVTLSTATIVTVYGILERLGIDKHLWVQDVQTRVFSTLGQPNWLAAYLVALIPLAMGFALQEFTEHSVQRTGKHIVRFGFYCALSTLCFLTLLFTRSRSGLFGFAVADVVFWALVFIRPGLAWQGLALRNVRSAFLPFIMCHVAFVILVFLNGTHIDALDRFVTYQGLQHALNLKTNNAKRLTKNESTPSGTLLETGGTESGTIRKYVWQGAVNAWNSSWKTRLIGTGTETFAFAFYQFKPKAHNLTSEWDFLYNKAHNEYLNYLATTGLFGLGSYLLFIGVCIIWFLRVHSLQYTVHRKNDHAKNNELITMNAALFAGWLSIVVTNFFGFSVVIVQLFFFLFPALAFVSTEKKFFRVISFAFNGKLRKAISGALLFVLLALLVLLSLLWYADTLFAKGYRLNRVSQFPQAELLLTRAIQLNPSEPLYYDERATARTGLVDLSIEGKLATAAAVQAKSAMEDSDTALKIAPRNVNYWKSRTKMYYAFSSFDPEFNKAAITALVRGQELSPLDPKITYNLAILYGRQNDMNKAIELLKQSIDLKRNYRDAYYALSIFYTEARKPDLAKQVLADYLTTVDPNDKDFLERIK